MARAWLRPTAPRRCRGRFLGAAGDTVSSHLPRVMTGATATLVVLGLSLTVAAGRRTRWPTGLRRPRRPHALHPGRVRPDRRRPGGAVSREGGEGRERRPRPARPVGSCAVPSPPSGLMLVWVLLWGTFSWPACSAASPSGSSCPVVFPLPRHPAGLDPAGGGARRGRALRRRPRRVEPPGGLAVSAGRRRPDPQLGDRGPLESSSEFVMAMVSEVLSACPCPAAWSSRPGPRNGRSSHVLGADDARAVATSASSPPARGRHRGGPRRCRRADRPRGFRRRRGEPIGAPCPPCSTPSSSSPSCCSGSPRPASSCAAGPDGARPPRRARRPRRRVPLRLVAYAALTGELSLVPVVVAIGLVASSARPPRHGSCNGGPGDEHGELVLDTIGTVAIVLGAPADVRRLDRPAVAARRTQPHARRHEAAGSSCLIVIGGALHLRTSPDVWMLVLVGAFQLVTAPVTAHVVGRLAHRSKAASATTCCTSTN